MTTESTDKNDDELCFDDLSIVVLSYNRRQELLQNLINLCEIHLSKGAELIIVDNNSDDGTQADLRALQARIPTLKIIFSDRNLGVADGRNTGWEAATKSLILNLDDDTRIDVDAIQALRAAAHTLPAVGIFTPKVVHAVTDACQNGYGDDMTEPANFHGACHLVRAQVWQSVGRIDSQCTFGGEELDYTIRARSLGYATVFLPEVKVRHNSLPRQGGIGKWRRQRWVFNFSRIFFKHFPIRHAAPFLIRYLIAQVMSAIYAGEWGVVPSLFYHALLGMLDGRRSYAPIPRIVLRFYTNYRLAPDFGNRPVSHKIFRRFAKLSFG